MEEEQSIKNTLEVIRKALEDENSSNSSEFYDNVLILNQLVKEDGTIGVINNDSLNKAEVVNILNKKLDEVFNEYLTKWLDTNVPSYLEKYFKNKNL